MDPAPPSPESPQPSYRKRNTVLAIAALVTIVAAVVRLSQTATHEAPAAPPAAVAPAAAMPTTTAVAAAGAVDVDVSYAGAIAALPDTAKVYVFIRPVGERMPLAVQTYTPKDLPVAVEFSNPSGASAAARIEAVARLSMTGSVTLQTGDSEAVSAPVQFGASPVRVSLTLGAAGGAAPVAAAQLPAPGAPLPAAGALPKQALRLAVHVALGAGVDLPPATTVFVVVRESGGSPMPLAVKRLTVGDLPADLVLSDADAMMPGRKLGDVAAVEVVARASRSGDVKAAPGDVEARSGVLPTKGVDPNVPIQLVIVHPV